MSAGIRLQKYLSRAGRASRREAEQLMRAGRVRVNGKVVSELGARVLPDRDVVELDGGVVTLPPLRWVAFHKPPGVLTTRSDPYGGPTVYDRLPAELEGLRYVGRLDRETEGLLLLTNDGEAAHRLQHPSGGVEREYRVEVEGAIGRAEVLRILAGVELEDGPARARSVEIVEVGAGRSTLDLVLTEGRKREVRRMMSAVGHPVLRLRRTRFGTVRLGALGPGDFRDLGEAEVDELRSCGVSPRPRRD
ncbi:MAG TPA: pseudouridine synthase [Longimicrobiales bacterium]|nr:pseudouridine synthase [Longimicrobiales bacterium]